MSFTNLAEKTCYTEQLLMSVLSRDELMCLMNAERGKKIIIFSYEVLNLVIKTKLLIILFSLIISYKSINSINSVR